MVLLYKFILLFICKMNVSIIANINFGILANLSNASKYLAPQLEIHINPYLSSKPLTCFEISKVPHTLKNDVKNNQGKFISIPVYAQGLYLAISRNT